MRFLPKSAVLVLCSALLLASCNGAAKTTYLMDFDIPDAAIREELIWGSLRLMEATAAKLDTELADKEVSVGSGTTAIGVSLKNPSAMADMSAALTEPFTLRFMREAGETASGSGVISVPDHGDFVDTGVGADDIFWAEAAEDDGGRGAVRLLFSQDGRVRLEQMLAANKGKTIGLFVRDRLVGKLLADDIKDEVVLRGIPTSEQAFAFADLVNVGLHVTFTPAP